jgi:hypothetical protein
MPNHDQMDSDADGIGNVCDLDDDGDSWSDALDNCPLVANNAQTDTDDDGVGDACDNCAGQVNPQQEDSDAVEAAFVHVQDDATQDCFDTAVCLWRDVTGPIDNFYSGGTPAAIEWACDRCESPSSAFEVDIRTHRDTCFGSDLGNLVGRYTCLHVADTNTYWNVFWTAWQTGGGGGFSYVRTTYDAGNACDNCWAVVDVDQTDTDSDCPAMPFTSDPVCGDPCDP